MALARRRSARVRRARAGCRGRCRPRSARRRSELARSFRRTSCSTLNLRNDGVVLVSKLSVVGRYSGDYAGSQVVLEGHAMRTLLVLCVVIISSAAIAQSNKQRTYGRDKPKSSYHGCMVKLHSYGLSPRTALNRCRLFNRPGGVSR